MIENKIKYAILPLLYILVSVSQGNAQFTAELTDVQKGDKKIYKVQSDGVKYRYDFNENGERGIVIVDPVSNQTSILMPDKKFVHHTEPFASISLMNDPYQSFNYMRTTYEEKSIGLEKLNGVQTQVIELWAGDQKIFTAWHSGDLNFLVKMVNHLVNDTYVELTNIKSGKLNKDIFLIAADFVEVDDRMRVKIPEPPPPSSWNERSESVPFNKIFKRGDRITFSIDHSSYTKIFLLNQGEIPAKMIRYIYQSGQLLPESEQGPVSYRTKRLHTGEKSTLTQAWKVGAKVVFEFYEGEMKVEVKPEKDGI